MQVSPISELPRAHVTLQSIFPATCYIPKGIIPKNFSLRCRIEKKIFENMFKDRKKTASNGLPACILFYSELTLNKDHCCPLVTEADVSERHESHKVRLCLGRPGEATFIDSHLDFD